jgi:monoamine oxidase
VLVDRRIFANTWAYGGRMIEPVSQRDIAAAASDGLPKRSGPGRRVVIVGAGMAGLVAGLALLEAGHEVAILEGRARVGGRIHTVREPFSDGLYAEGGAMRIPQSHQLTMAFCRRFNLTLRPFTSGNPQAFVHLCGRRYRSRDLQANPHLLPYDLARLEHGRSIHELWSSTIAEIAAAVRARGDEAWSEIVHELDELSMREFLESRGWSDAAIELFGLVVFQEALMNSACLELIREELHLCYVNLFEIDGGMDRLPQAFLPALAPHIRFGARMLAFDQSDHAVRVHYQTVGGRFSDTGDYLIVTVPFPALRHVEAIKPLSLDLQRAIRQLRYNAATKILMQFRRRFWEDDDGIVGGGSVTDLPIRAVYYPDHHRDTGRGVLLASYTWNEDAQRWGALPPADRLREALEHLAALHPQAPVAFEAGASVTWHDDPFAGGAFALFDPGQRSRLHDIFVRPEGRIYFAGEHTALAHAWIQGAIESGLRAAIQVHHRP